MEKVALNQEFMRDVAEAVQARLTRENVDKEFLPIVISLVFIAAGLLASAGLNKDDAAELIMETFSQAFDTAKGQVDAAREMLEEISAAMEDDDEGGLLH